MGTNALGESKISAEVPYSVGDKSQYSTLG